MGGRTEDSQLFSLPGSRLYSFTALVIRFSGLCEKEVGHGPIGVRLPAS